MRKVKILALPEDIFLGVENGNPSQYPCLGNPMDRGAWSVTVHGVTWSQTWLHTHTKTSLVSQLGRCYRVEATDKPFKVQGLLPQRTAGPRMSVAEAEKP